MTVGGNSGETGWTDILTRMRVVGTIDITRLIPTYKIAEGLKAKMSVGKMHQLIVGRPLTGAHRAGTDVDGVINIISHTTVTKNVMSKPSAIPIHQWLKHSNHSKARLDWEEKMKEEVKAEDHSGLAIASAVTISGGINVDIDVDEQSISTQESMAD